MYIYTNIDMLDNILALHMLKFQPLVTVAGGCILSRRLTLRCGVGVDNLPRVLGYVSKVVVFKTSV